MTPDNSDFQLQNEARRISLVNSISLISFLSILVFVVYYSFLDFKAFKQQILVLVLGAVCVLFPILLNKVRKHQIAKIYISSYNTILVFFIISYYGGRAYGTHILFLLFAIIPIFLWSVREKLYIFFFYGINISLYIVLEFFKLSFLRTTSLSLEYSTATKGVIILVSYTGATIAIIIFHRLSSVKENQLHAQNKLIGNQKLELEKLNSSLEQKIEELTNQKKELKHLNSVKAKIYSVIAHDLRSPISSMNSLLTFLNEDFDQLSEEELKRNINSLQNTSQNSFALLENLLEWSRMQSSRIKLNIEELNINELAEDAIEHNKDLLQKKELKLISEINTHQIIVGDMHMLSTVFRNLISNAIKFTAREGTITIKAEQKNKKFIEVSISDTGIGMTQKQQEKLFSVEHSFIRRGTENERGSGLGLVICKEFIEKNKGELSVQSQTGKGSTFSFTLRSS